MARLRSAAGEFLLVAALFLVYKAARILTAGHANEAVANAESMWHLERSLRLPSELAVQQGMAGQHWLVLAANVYYAYVHFPATVACLVWLYVRRPGLYLRTRRVLAGLTAAALVCHVWFPLAPPRLVPSTGLLDTGSVYGPAVYGPPDTDTLSNQFAAMPSLHVGWAVVVALAVIAATRGRLRWIWLAHPVITLGVVVTTGNHYWFDALVAVALLAVVHAVTARATRLLPAVAGPWLRQLRGRIPAIGGAVVRALRRRVPDPLAVDAVPVDAVPRDPMPDGSPRRSWHGSPAGPPPSVTVNVVPRRRTPLDDVSQGDPAVTRAHVNTDKVDPAEVDRSRPARVTVL